MRYLILVGCLALAANALAEEKPKTLTVTKEVDKSSPMLMSTSSTSDSTGTSETEQRSVASPRDAASGMPTGRRQHGRTAEGGDYNSSRSNKTHGVNRDGGSGSSGGTRAQDYNSSRSNTTTLREDKSGDLDRDGRPDLATCGNGVDNDCDSAGATSPANHNTTRSNRTRAQDYNSSRSNNSSSRLDPDSDGDSVLTETRCSMANDSCVEYQNGDDPVTRKRPGR